MVLCSRHIDSLKKKFRLYKNVHIFSVDVTKEQQVKNLFTEIKTLKITLDVVINSAGLALGLETVDKGYIPDWNKMIDTNIKGLIMISKFALKDMIKRNNGLIINIGSIAGINSYSKGVIYAATKAAVKSISDGLRKEIVQNNIKITNIQPGLVETNFSKVRFKGDIEKAKNVYEGIEPLTAKDIASIVKYIINLPKHIQINEVTVTPVHQATVEVIYKKT